MNEKRLPESITAEELVNARDVNGRFTAKNVWTVIKRNAGRKFMYEDADILLIVILDYFEWCDQLKQKYSYSHLCLWLGMSKQAYHEYKHNPKYAEAIGIAELIFEGDSEQKLMWAGSTMGAIFKLKNKHGWKDESTQHQHQNITSVTPQIIKNNDTPLLGNNDK